jgi:hypothetical protein
VDPQEPLISDISILAPVPLLTSGQLSAAFRYADENADAIAHNLAENEDGE